MINRYCNYCEMQKSSKSLSLCYIKIFLKIKKINDTSDVNGIKCICEKILDSYIDNFYI